MTATGFHWKNCVNVMGFKPVLNKEASKYICRQSLANQTRIADAIAKLPDGDVKKMQGRDGYRLTIGGFRVLFDYADKYTEDGTQIIDVFLIGPRGDIYKK